MKYSMLGTPVRRMRMLMALFAVALLGGMRAEAQTFQNVHGGKCWEAGYRGVAQVTGCSSGGFISAGISFTPLSATALCRTTSDVYVVRTSTAGATLWERTYNIFGTAGVSDDSAASIKEIPDGFIITGTTTNPQTGKTNIFLLKIRCDGSVVWSKVYKSSNQSKEGARDIIVTKHGDGNPNKAGDYVIAGWTDTSGTGANVDAFLMRTDTVGNIRWNKAYDPGTGGHEQFFAVIETDQGDTSDLVAAGGSTSFAGLGEQGYVVRVSGNNGTFGLSPQGSAHFGNSGSERFFGVRELTNGALGSNKANLVFVGYTRAVGAAIGQEDLYVVKTTMSPCIKLASRVIGGTNRDMAYDVVEILNANDRLITGQSKVVSVGDLAVVGATNHNTTGGAGTVLTDAFLLPLKVATLAPAGGGFLYGDGVLSVNGNLANDGACSVAEVGGTAGNGFIICGYTQSNLEGASPADPQDMYMIRTDPPNGSDGCYLGWSPASADSGWSANCDTPDVRPVISVDSVVPVMSQPSWRNNVCTCALCKRVVSPGALTDDAEAPAEAMVSYPNPVKRGDKVTIDFHTHRSGQADLVVTDALGNVVSQSALALNGEPMELTLNTDGWRAGAYVVAVHEGSTTRSVRVIVIE